MLTEEILWCLDYNEGIKGTVEKIEGKKAKLGWLMDHHPYLPDQEIAELSGYTKRGVIKAREVRSCVGLPLAA